MFHMTPQPPYGSALPRVETQFFTAELLPRQNFYHSVIPSCPHTPARAPADAEIFLLRLSHKDGIKKVENTPPLAFPLQAVADKGLKLKLIETN